jgi:hypothetical protein
VYNPQIATRLYRLVVRHSPPHMVMGIRDYQADTGTCDGLVVKPAI